MRSLLGRFHRPNARSQSEQLFMLNNLGDGSTLSLDFTTGVLDSRLTFTRSTTGTYINSSGYVTSAAINTPRFDYDPTALTPRGLLIEGSAVNLQTYSADLSQTGTWTQQALAGVTANVSGIYDPANGTSASKIRSSSAASTAHLVYSTLATVSGTAYTMSAWVRAAEYNFAALHFASGANRYTVVFNLTTGAVTQTTPYGSPTGTGSNAVKFGDWWRLSLTMNAADTTSYPHICLSSTATPSVNAFGQPAFTGTAESGVYVWGAQLEAGSGASSYIPTGASQGSRAQDQMQMANLTAVNFNTAAGTMLINGTYNRDANAFPRTIRFMGSAVQSMAMITAGKTLYGNAPNTSGGAYIETSRTLSTFGAFKYGFTLTTAANPALATATVSLNGAGTTITPLGQGAITNPITLDFLYGAGATSDYPSMAVSSLKYFPYAMTSADLNARTT